MDALQYLDSMRNAHPELACWLNSLADLYQKKLWHQLSLQLEQFIYLSVFQLLDLEKVEAKGFQFMQAGDDLILLYHNFITDFETKINLLKLAHFAVRVSRQYSEKEAAIRFLEGVIEKLSPTKEQRIEEPILYIKMQMALIKLEQGDQKECKKILEDGKSTLDSLTDIDPSVYARFYWASSQYHKYRQEFSDFYKSALLYLAYSSVKSLSESLKLLYERDLASDPSLSTFLGDDNFNLDELPDCPFDLPSDLSIFAPLGDDIYYFGDLLARPVDLASDLSLSALLGDDIFNFGELLARPILKILLGTEVEWLYCMLEAFNTGNLIRYQELCRVHNDALRAQPALIQNEKKLLEKINVLCLMEIIFSRSSEDRTIPLSFIAERTKLSIEDVEHLLMRSLSVHLMEGIIDEVEGTVHVTWVQPRVLGIPQIQSLRDHLDTWLDKVHITLVSVESETPDFISSSSLYDVVCPGKRNTKVI